MAGNARLPDDEPDNNVCSRPKAYHGIRQPAFFAKLSKKSMS